MNSLHNDMLMYQHQLFLTRLHYFLQILTLNINNPKSKDTQSLRYLLKEPQQKLTLLFKLAMEFQSQSSEDYQWFYSHFIHNALILKKVRPIYEDTLSFLDDVAVPPYATECPATSIRCRNMFLAGCLTVKRRNQRIPFGVTKPTDDEGDLMITAVRKIGPQSTMLTKQDFKKKSVARRATPKDVLDHWRAWTERPFEFLERPPQPKPY